MNRSAWALILAVVLAAPAWAASSASSTASESLAASSGSVSASLTGSSNSSRRDVAEGDYRLIEVADAPNRPHDVTLTLQQGEAVVKLTLPRTTFAGTKLAAGDVVAATQRDYGLEFRHGATRQAFFLVLDDDWQRELKSVPVEG